MCDICLMKILQNGYKKVEYIDNPISGNIVDGIIPPDKKIEVIQVFNKDTGELEMMFASGLMVANLTRTIS